MPTYKFRHRETGEEFEEFMKISDFDEYKELHPHLESVPNGGPAIGDPLRLGRMKPSQDFRDRLKQIKSVHPHNTIDIP